MDIYAMEKRATHIRAVKTHEAWVYQDVDKLVEFERQLNGGWHYHLSRIRESGDPMMADDKYYLDYRLPFNTADKSTITLATTDKGMYSTGDHPVFGGQYWSMLGKKVQYRAFGKFTTGTTPGNLTVDWYYGTGADANGTIVVSSAAVALAASQTNLSWQCQTTFHCRTTGTSGALFGDGELHANNALLATTVQPVVIPASAAAASGAIDLTAANIISLQFKRSGSTAETATVQDLDITSMN